MSGSLSRALLLNNIHPSSLKDMEGIADKRDRDKNTIEDKIILEGTIST